MRALLLLTVAFSTVGANSTEPPPTLDEKIDTISRKLSEEVLYCSAGILFGSASLVARLGWGLCLISPWASTVGNECLLVSHMCGSAAGHAFSQMFKESSTSKVPLSHHSWHENQTLLSQTPAFSDEEKKLLLFLEKRWLAKSTGFISSVVDWVCPCFEVSMQVNPEMSHSYARSPAIGFSQVYKNRMEAWKQSLPHPHHYPLILTRPYDLQDYLPCLIDVPQDEKIETTIERSALKMATDDTRVVVDVTSIFPADPQQWLPAWTAYRDQFSKACKEHDLNPNRILCIQRVRQEEIGGIRLLPLAGDVELNNQFLINWISTFGLTANRIELDRWPASNAPSHNSSSPLAIEFESKEEFLSCLNSFHSKSDNPQKKLMIQGSLQVLKGLLAHISDEKWDEIARCPTRSTVAHASFLRIKEKLNHLAQESDEILFFDSVAHIEEIHANLSSLLEIFSPFTSADFSMICQDLLTSIPPPLKSLTSYGVHSSGMTTLAGVFKAVERTVGKPSRILYGANTYFECNRAAHWIANASSIDEATEDDWKEVDLLIAQFNPVLNRIDFQISEYKVERIAETLHKTLNVRQGKPLTVVLDSTLDYINSPRVEELLAEFHTEIENGTLNFICYRSGLKFDLFGMDNYCGSPFFMIHNHDAKWAFFDTLLTDPVLLTDRLSLNWFCLAYQNAVPELELYQKQIFDNTRSLLNKAPARLLDKHSAFRIIPIEEGADPAFIDIKISGALHQIRGPALVAGCLSLKCMEGKQPIFYRPGLGFYHPNFTMIFDKECSTVRLTLGLDPAQVDVLAQCFELIDTLNSSPCKVLQDKLESNY